MEITTLVGSLGKALWDIKTMCDQHKVNKSDIQELYNFIQDLQQCTPALEKRLTECGRDHLGKIMLKKLAKDINNGIEKLNKWSTDRSFFRILTASERKVELQNMHVKVMSSMHKNLTIASLSVLLDVRASQATIIEQGTEMKSLLTASIESVQGRMLPEVKARVVEASRSPFADEKFWQDVLAAVDSRHGADYVSRDELSNVYEDPITAELMIDPVVASNGDTYCRWTIIDNDIKRNPVNLDEALTIVVDNLVIRRGLFVAFPEQFVKFQQRRQQYRLQALSWVRNGMLADAEVALRNVLRWDKNDKECAELLVNVRRALKKAKGKYNEPSPLLTDQDQLCDIATEHMLTVSNFDSVWKNVLPPKYKDSARFTSKREIFDYLCNPMVFANKTQAFWIDRDTGGVCRSVGAKGINIIWVTDPRYWDWVSNRGSLFPEVARLLDVCWFEANGEMEFSLPPGAYTFTWRLYLADLQGWDNEPATFTLWKKDAENFECKCNIDHDPHVSRRVVKPFPSPTVRILETGWSEYDVGEFIVKKGEEICSLKFKMTAHQRQSWKSGLLMDGIVIRPTEMVKRISSIASCRAESHPHKPKSQPGQREVSRRYFTGLPNFLRGVGNS